METINERVKEIRRYENLTLEKFGEPLGVTSASISRIENGINDVTERMIKIICSTYFISEEWLRTGKGSMHGEEIDDLYLTRWTAKVLKDNPSSFQRRFASALSRLSLDEWAILEKMCIEIVAGHNQTTNPSENPYSDIPYDSDKFEEKYNITNSNQKNGKTG